MTNKFTVWDDSDEIVFAPKCELGDITGEEQNNGYYGMPAPDDIIFGSESGLGEF